MENFLSLNLEPTLVESIAKINFKTGERIKFFNLGIKNDWKKILDPEIKKSLEKELQNELKELKYIL